MNEQLSIRTENGYRHRSTLGSIYAALVEKHIEGNGKGPTRPAYSSRPKRPRPPRVTESVRRAIKEFCKTNSQAAAARKFGVSTFFVSILMHPRKRKES
jgi:DNA invertase Pin-like site-specific DNA recombinase